MNNSRAIDRAYIAMNLYHYCNDAIVFLIPSVLGQFYKLFHLNYLETSIVLAFNLGFTVLFQTLNGFLMDKNHEKFLIYTGLGLTALSTYLLFFSSDFYSLWFLASLNGIALGFAHAIIYAAGAKLFPTNRDKKMAKQGSAGDGGKLSAILTSAIILGIDNNAWQIPFLIWGTIATISFVMVFFLLRNFSFSSLNQASDSIPQVINQNAQEVALRKRSIVLLFFMSTIYWGSSDIITKTYTVFLTTARVGLSNQFAVALFAVLLGAGTLGSYTSGYIKAKLGIRKFLTIIYIDLLILLLLYTLINLDNIIFDAIFIALIGYHLLAIYITIQSELSFYLNPKRLGIGYGLLLGVSWGGSTLTVFLIGPLAGTFGPQIYFITSFIMSLIVFGLVQVVPIRPLPKSINLN